MSSLHGSAAHSAASTKNASSPARYMELYTGPIVEIKISGRARSGRYDLNGKDIPFFQFARNVKGGMINFFVHTDDDSVCGRTIKAVATVVQKTLDGGRVFLHIDLKPVDTDTEVTHRLLTMAPFDLQPEADWPHFRTPKPLNAIIAFAPPDFKAGQFE